MPNYDIDSWDAVEALRDTLVYYNAQVDNDIADHTESGNHPDRPTTAREYFTEMRGWDAATVDGLLLGWAPPDHVDELVAFLHERGHSREAMLATGAIGENDHGGLYTTFTGRYVFPYYDANGDPTYAIARCTGGDGGGARGYGGHPADYQAGKYAKLRHTDKRVPFDEPIYGLDTLEEGEHAVVAEGIADAITAREDGYAVLSPVAKEFKEDHLDPLVEALEAHAVDRVTIVADADCIRGDAAIDADPKTVAEAAGILAPTGAGLAGALRTASKLGDRTDADLRVVKPPAPADTENDLDEFVTGAWAGDLDALLASAKPATAFDELEAVTRSTGSAEAAAEFDAEEYEPTATTADETTDDIHDIYHALDRLDAQRVAEDTIVDEWLEGPQDHRTFRPTWASADYTGTAVYCDHDKFVDTGDRAGLGGPAVMAAIDAGLVRDTQCPDAVDGETWVQAVDHLRNLGYAIPQLETVDDSEEYRTDPRERTATVDARRAWDAAGRVTPNEVDGFDLYATDDGKAWRTDSGERVGDVVRAVALDAGLIERVDDDLDDYPAAYNRAREEYDAPIPRYYTTADAVAEFEAVLDVIAETTFFDLDREVLNSEITEEGDEVGGDAVRALNPAWRESESGRSVLVFENGTVWDADTERVVDVLRLVALDSGLIEGPGVPLEGERFTEAYRRARTEYGAPLPRWEPAEDGAREITPQLPPSEDVVDTFDYDGVDDDELTEARKDVEDLIGEVTSKAGEPTVVTALPATGKTTGTIKTAGDRPLSYLAQRKELQQQALRKAEEWGVEARICPVFCDENPRDDVLAEAVSHVRQQSKRKLRQRWAVLDEAFAGVNEEIPTDPEELFVDEDDDTVDLDRPTCETARGDHGIDWALVVHVARRLGYTPREIHRDAEGLFGAPLPCDAGDGCTCEYADGWDHVADADEPTDLVVGSYGHAHVESVRTKYERGPDGERERKTRALVLDEFPGEAFVSEFEEEAVDHAMWLAKCLVDGVEDRRDMRDADLHSDEWVTAWLQGNGDEIATETVGALERIGHWFDAREAADEILTEVDSEVLNALGILDALERVADGETVDVVGDLGTALDAVNPNQPAAGVAEWASDEVLEDLADATVNGVVEPSVDAVTTDELPEEGDLRGLVDRAVDAVEERRDDARVAIEAAVTALRGGRDGCRRLAAWADDGYAHPDAHHLLEADITPTGDDATGGRRIYTDSWAFDENATDGTIVERVETGEKSVVVADRNDHGARLHTPPSREAGGGGEVPLVGLDATGRPELWEISLGEAVETADIHATDRERAEFLESALGLRVIQAADRPRAYSGDPESKDTDGDVALLQAIDEEYSGIEAPRDRDGVVDAVGVPAAITTKDVREKLENDTRLDDFVAAWEHYGNLTGANDLGEHRLAAILGSQHYGDDAVERFCALAGEEVDTERNSARGSALDYGSDLAKAYLRHMREDQTMQAVLRFARGDTGATVVARTSALREDLPIVGDGQVVETWSDTATEIARAYRRLGGPFTVADVGDAVDVTKRQVRRVLAELREAGCLRRVENTDGRAGVWESAAADPGAGEVELPDRDKAVAARCEPRRSTHSVYYTWNVRVSGLSKPGIRGEPDMQSSALSAPPSPEVVDGVEPLR